MRKSLVLVGPQLSGKSFLTNAIKRLLPIKTEYINLSFDHLQKLTINEVIESKMVFVDECISPEKVIAYDSLIREACRMTSNTVTLIYCMQGSCDGAVFPDKDFNKIDCKYY